MGVKISPPQLIPDWEARSGLTPAEAYSIADHMLTAFVLEHPDDEERFTLNDFIAEYGYDAP
jgi:hypothetical protein